MVLVVVVRRLALVLATLVQVAAVIQAALTLAVIQTNEIVNAQNDQQLVDKDVNNSKRCSLGEEK